METDGQSFVVNLSTVKQRRRNILVVNVDSTAHVDEIKRPNSNKQGPNSVLALIINGPWHLLRIPH